MSINLIDLAKNYLSDAVVGKLASSIGLDPNTASGIIDKVFPALLGAFGEKAQTEGGAADVFNSINEADDGILDNLSDVFSGDNSEMIEKGKGLLMTLLGGNFSSLSESLGSIPGLSTGKIGGLLGLLAPILTGMLKKQVVKGGLDASGLSSLLGDQKEHIASSLGGDLLGKLGLGAFTGTADKIADAAKGAVSAVGGVASAAGDTASNAASAVGDAASNTAGAVTDAASAVGDAASGAVSAVGGAASSIGAGAANLVGDTAATASAATKQAGSGFMKFLPLLILGLLAFLGLKMCKKAGVGGSVTDVIDKTTQAVADTASEAGNAVTEGAGSLTEAAGDTIGGLKDGAVELGNKAVDAAGDATSAVAEGTKNAVGSAGAAISEGASNIADATGDVIKSTAEGASNLGGKAVDAVGNAGSAIGNAAGGAVDATTGALGNAAEAVTEAAAKTSAAFLPTFEEGATPVELSEKAVNLARRLDGINVSDPATLDAIYEKFGNSGDSQFLYRIPFATGETGVPASHQNALIAKLKEADPNATLVTIGYADVRGDDALNKKLSYGRAKEIGEWIKSTLGNNTNIEAFSMGETDRFSKDEFSKNRVVEVWQIK